jgi:hypothetical protein
VVGAFRCDKVLIRARVFRGVIDKLVVVLGEHSSVLSLEHALVFGSDAGLV